MLFILLKQMFINLKLCFVACIKLRVSHYFLLKCIFKNMTSQTLKRHELFWNTSRYIQSLGSCSLIFPPNQAHWCSLVLHYPEARMLPYVIRNHGCFSNMASLGRRRGVPVSRERSVTSRLCHLTEM